MTCNQNCEQGRRCGCARSDTPRTDARIGQQMKDRPEWVDADVSRALERELAEQCRLNAMGSEREAWLMARVAELEKLSSAISRDAKESDKATQLAELRQVVEDAKKYGVAEAHMEPGKVAQLVDEFDRIHNTERERP